MQDKTKRQPKISGWKLFNLITMLLIASVLIGVVIGNKGFDGLLNRWGSLDATWMALGVLCMALYWVLEGVTVHILVACLYHGVPFRCSMRTAMIGHLYSAITPFASGGQPVQVFYMHRDGLDTGGAASVMTIKSVVYQLGVMFLALLSLLSSYRFFADRVPAFGWLAILGFLTNVVMTSAMLLLAFSPKVTHKLYRVLMVVLHFFHLVKDVDASMAKAQTQFDIFHQSTKRYEKKRSVFWQSLIATVLQLLLLYSVSYTVYRALGYNEPGAALHAIPAIAFVSMVSSFVPLPGGSGGAEGAFLVFFALFYTQPDLLVALLLWRFTTYYLGIIVGSVVAMVSRKRERASIRLRT